MKRALILILMMIAACFFTMPAAAMVDGLSVLIVIDNSSSMIYSDPDKTVIEKLKNLITDMDTNASAGIALFDGGFTEVSPVISLATPENVQELCKKLDSIRFTGEYTDAGSALSEADKILEHAAKPVLIFVGDGIINVPGNAEFTAKGASNASRNAFRELAQSFEYPFYPLFVNFAMASDGEFEDNLSDTGIKCLYIKNSEEADSVFADLTNSLQQSYYELETFRVNSDNLVVDAVQTGEPFGFFVQFKDNNSKTLALPYASQCTAVLEIGGYQYPMTCTDEGTAFFSELSFEDGGQYDAIVTVSHESGKVYTKSSVITIEAIPKEPVHESAEEEPEIESSSNEMMGVFAFCMSLGAVIAFVSVAQKRRNQPPTGPNIKIQYKLIDEFNHVGPELAAEISAYRKTPLSDILTTKDNAGYIFHDINNISFKISRSGNLTVENVSRYKIRMEDGEQPSIFEFASDEWIRICPTGDINAAAISLTWKNGAFHNV